MDPNAGSCLHLVSDYDTKMLLEMRKNICFYAQILDEFAPCLVLAKNWNNDMKMNLYCSTTNQRLWQQHVSSVSDEAFIVLVLLNDSRRWCATGSITATNFLLDQPLKNSPLTSRHIYKTLSTLNKLSVGTTQSRFLQQEMAHHCIHGHAHTESAGLSKRRRPNALYYICHS